MRLTNFGVAITAAVLAASALSGCSKVAEIKEAATTAAEQVHVVESGIADAVDSVSVDLFTAEGIDAAYGAISEKVGANPMQVVEVTIVKGVLNVEAVDPKAPTELNEWSYVNGAVGPSRPVDYGDDVDALQQNIFAVDEVAPSAIATAIDGASAAAKLPDGDVQSLIIKRNMPFDTDVTMFINVQGERSSKQVRADAAGRITEVL